MVPELRSDLLSLLRLALRLAGRFLLLLLLLRLLARTLHVDSATEVSALGARCGKGVRG